MSDLKNWYLLQFKPNAHRLAIRNLERQGFETFLPMQEVTHRKAARFVNDLRPLFPGYMFVNFDSSTMPWKKINSTMGVSKLVNLGGKIQPMPDDLVTGLRARCDENGKLQTTQDFQKGEKVRLTNGPFSDFIATVETVDEQQRVWALIELMGQKTRIELNGKQVEKLD